MGSIAVFLTSLALLLLGVASLMGLIYTTPLGFGNTKIQEYSPAKRRYIKIFLILTWIGTILNILYLIYNIAFIV
jgi:hypothetical protein